MKTVTAIIQIEYEVPDSYLSDDMKDELRTNLFKSLQTVTHSTEYKFAIKGLSYIRKEE